MPVQLHDFTQMGGIFFSSPAQVAEALRTVPKNPLLESGIFYPKFYDSNPQTLELLGFVVQKFSPSKIVETGVANGASTRRILDAFQSFGLTDSRLHSIDVDARVATPDLMKNAQFRFHHLGENDTFEEIMDAIGTIDFFYHDSDHSFRNQMLEYSIAWESLNSENGILMSDDINWSNAFLDFCKKVNRSPLLLADGSTFSGIIVK